MFYLFAKLHRTTIFPTCPSMQQDFHLGCCWGTVLFQLYLGGYRYQTYFWEGELCVFKKQHKGIANLFVFFIVILRISSVKTCVAWIQKLPCEWLNENQYIVVMFYSYSLLRRNSEPAKDSSGSGHSFDHRNPSTSWPIRTEWDWELLVKQL